MTYVLCYYIVLGLNCCNTQMFVCCNKTRCSLKYLQLNCQLQRLRNTSCESAKGASAVLPGCWAVSGELLCRQAAQTL